MRRLVFGVSEDSRAGTYSTFTDPALTGRMCSDLAVRCPVSVKAGSRPTIGVPVGRLVRRSDLPPIVELHAA